jgi:hypothetical protein
MLPWDEESKEWYVTGVPRGGFPRAGILVRGYHACRDTRDPHDQLDLVERV